MKYSKKELRLWSTLYYSLDYVHRSLDYWEHYEVAYFMEFVIKELSLWSTLCRSLVYGVHYVGA